IRNRNNKERKIAENLFLNKTGAEIKTVANLQTMIKETAIKANVRESVRASPHTFRHYWTVKNLNLGQDIFTISKILGHSKLDTTKIYISSITDEQLITKAKQTSPLSDIL
ncbi:tyrosine-type recombinase/integrase, partial [Enterococcus cecorum]|uniref:tyrosine-type recombinase/integrase n=2 Tax=Enterococcus TaxID=1350 RepID=UPI001FAD7531